MGRYEEVARDIIGLVERRIRQVHTAANEMADGNGAKKPLSERDHSIFEAEVARRLAEVMDLKHNCINCENLKAEEWTCREGIVDHIDNPFEERAKCNAWKPGENSIGIGPFPACTPEYEFFVWDEADGKLVDNFGGVIVADKDRDSKEKKDADSSSGEASNRTPLTTK